MCRRQHKKLRIPSPITSDFSFNTKWLTEGSLTADFDGKRNTAELVADAKNGVYDVEMAILLNGMEPPRAYGHHTKCLNTQQFVRLVMIKTV